MFQHTLDPPARLTPWERVVVVAARHHQDGLWSQLDGRPIGVLLLQPKNGDTAAGLFRQVKMMFNWRCAYANKSVSWGVSSDRALGGFIHRQPVRRDTKAYSQQQEGRQANGLEQQRRTLCLHW